MPEGDEPRVAPLPLDQWDDRILAALQQGEGSLLSDQLKSALRDGDLPRLAEILPNPITSMLHHPELTGRYLAMNGVHLSQSSLPARWRELLVLRVSWRARSAYEWRQHVRMAPRFDITPDEVRAIAEGTGTWTPLEGALLAAADQLMDRYSIDESTWRVLAEHLDRRQLIEVPFVVGTYTTFAMACGAFRVQLEPALAAVDPVVALPTDG